ncbi:MAG: GtrA family protein [Thermodesulfobacteriota bacterium]
MPKIILYFIFALIAVGVNLASQWPFFYFFRGPWVLYAALTAGTLSGLVTKYMLDKRWIFYYRARSRQDDAVRFSLYSLMGVFTTIIFWGTEAVFFYVFDFKGAQYAGGALGLCVGYTCKYFLDKHLVFRTKKCVFPDGVNTR